MRSSARKSGSAEPGVRVDDRRERDALEVVPLRDHLGAEQHPALALAEPVQRLGQARRLRCRVRIEPHEIELREAGSQLLLELLGTCPEPRELGGTARRTALGLLGFESAVVAVQAPVRMERQRDIAALAAEREPARPAVNRRSDAAPIEEEHGPPTVVRDAAERVEQRGRERVAGLPAQVDDLHRVASEPLRRLPSSSRSSRCQLSGRGVAVP